MGYNPHSMHADEFINQDAIIAAVNQARQLARDPMAVESILEKAAEGKGLTCQEGAALLCRDDDETVTRIFSLARGLKERFYGRRIVLFAPLYLSNYCINSCSYCPYHHANRHMVRKKLSQAEIFQEVMALQDMGHKRLAIEVGEDPANNPLEYILESINTIYGIKHKNGAVRRVNVNIAATTTDNYRLLRNAGIGTYILFQETYNRKVYEKIHPAGPKHDYAWHTEAMDRAMAGDIDDVGLGVLFGLDNFMREFVSLLMHAEHLEAVHGVGPHTISVPRIKPASGINPSQFVNTVDDTLFARICACIRLAAPYTGMIISTRESKKVREIALDCGVSQISGASRTSVGGYAETDKEEEDSSQFEVADRRSLDEIIDWLIGLGHVPSFCTACYRENRTGDRFMQLCKSGKIHNCCQPNALLTLKEYLEDYASRQTKLAGDRIIAEELNRIPNNRVRALTVEKLGLIEHGQRDFRF